MTKEQFDSLYYGKAVHCDTEEKAREFLALADSVGYKWFKEDISTEPTKWEIFKDETHYFVKEFWGEFVIEHGPSDYYLKYDIDCVEFIPQSQKLKVGDRVRINNPLYIIANGKTGVIERVNSLSPMSYVVRLDRYSWGFWYLTENELEKVNEPKAKEETIDDIIDEIKAKWSEINILLNRLEKKQKGE